MLQSGILFAAQAAVQAAGWAWKAGVVVSRLGMGSIRAFADPWEERPSAAVGAAVGTAVGTAAVDTVGWAHCYRS